MEAVENELRRLENDLLQPQVRQSCEALSALLAEEFCEFGASGRIYTRQEIIEALAKESPVRFSLSNFSIAMPASGVALIRYQATRHDETGQPGPVSLRSSLWVRRDHRWQILFHQGTTQFSRAAHLPPGCAGP